MKRAAVILITTIILTMTVGCQNTANKPLTQDKNQTNNTQLSVNNSQATVDEFENLAEQVPGVQRAYVAISTANTSATDNEAATIDNPSGNIDATPYGSGVAESKPQGVATDTSDSSSNNIVVMVGIKLDNSKDADNMTDIEKRVESKIKNADTRVTRVLVTADAGMIEQINNINTSIKNGTPVESIQKSINSLTRSLTVNQ